MLLSSWLSAIKMPFVNRSSRKIRKLHRRSTVTAAPAGIVERLEDRTLLAAIISGIADDTGILATDNVTTDNTLTLSGTFSGTGGVNIFDSVNGGAEGALGAATVSGTTWTFSTGALTTNATHVFRAVDTSDGLSGSRTVVIDSTAPTGTIAAAAGQTSPTNASPINFTVTFNEAAYGFNSGDLTFAGSTAAGPLVGAVTAVGSGRTTYNVAVTGMTGSGTVTLGVNTGAGSLTDAAGNNLTAAPATASVIYDITSPTVTVNQNAAGDGNATPTDPQPDPQLASVGGTINFTATFTDANGINAASFTNADVALGGTAGATSAVVTNLGGGVWNIAVTGMTQTGTVTASIPAGAVLDTAGNGNTASTSNVAEPNGSVTFTDDVAPTVTSSVRINASPTNATSVGFTVTFSEQVTGVDAADFALTPTGPITGASITSVTGSGAVYTVTVNTGSGSGAIRLDVVDNDTIQDLSGNRLGGTGTLFPNPPGGSGSFTAGESYAIDKTGPTVTINQAAGEVDPLSATVSTIVDFTAVFSENITGFTAADIAISGTAGATTATLTQTATATWNVAITGMTNSGTVIVSLPAGAVTDLFGNSSAASTSTDNQVTFNDNAFPTVLSSVPAVGQANPTNATSATFTVTFSEAVSGVDNSDFTLTLAAVTGASVTSVTPVSGSVYTVLINTGTGSGSIRLDVTDNDTIADGANNKLGGTGNGNGNFTTGTVLIIDKTAPTVTIDQAAPPAQTDPFAGPQTASINFTSIFSEVVTGFANNDVSLSGTAAASTATVRQESTLTVGGTPIATSTASVTINGTLITSAAVGGTFTTAELATVLVTAINANAAMIAAGISASNVAGTSATVTVQGAANGIQYTLTSPTATGGTATLTLNQAVGTRYNVAASGMTSSGTVIANIAASAATDAVGNASASSTSTDNTVTYNDNTGPNVTSINRASGQANPTNATSATFLVTFDENVSGVDAADFTLTTVSGTFTPGLGAANITTVSGSGNTRTVIVTGITGNGVIRLDLTDNNTIVDSSGNALGGGGFQNFTTGQTVTVDQASPALTINQATGQLDPTNQSPILFTVTFLEPVSGFTASDVTIASTAGTVSTTLSGGTRTTRITIGGGATGILAGDTFRATISTFNGTTADVVAQAVNYVATAADVAGTPAADAAAVAVGLRTAINAANLGITATDNAAGVITLTSNTSVRDFTETTTIPTNAGTGTVADLITGSPLVYTVTIDGASVSGGTVTASIAAGVATDAAGNNNLAASTTDNIVTFDNVSPTVTVNQAAGQADPTVLANGSVNFTVVFSENVVGFDVSGVVVGGTAPAVPGPVVITGTPGGTTYNVAVPVNAGTGSGTITVTVRAGAATDLAGNMSSASTSTDNSVTFNDGNAPGVLSSTPTLGVTPTSAATATFTVTFNEPVTGVDTADFSLNLGGAVTGASVAGVTGTGTTRTVTVNTGTGDGTIRLDVAPTAFITDQAGNALPGTGFFGGLTQAIDKTAPTVTVNQNAAGDGNPTGTDPQPDPTSASPINFTVTFSETVTGFTLADVTIGGTAGATTAVVTAISGSIYNVAISGMAITGSVTATIVTGAAVDGAGNASAAPTSTDNTVQFTDGVAPTVASIVRAVGQSNPTNGSSVTYTVTFSEPVSGVDLSDFTLTDVGGTITGESLTSFTAVSTSVYTVVASTGTAGSGDLRLDVTDDDTIIDLSTPPNKLGGTGLGNGSVAGGAPGTFAIDRIAPTVTINQKAAGDGNTAPDDVAQADPTATPSIRFTAIFSETVTGFATFDVSLIAGASNSAGATTAVVTAVSGTIYNITVTGMTQTGLVNPSILAGVATDLAGNSNAASTTTDSTVTFNDTVNPSVTTINRESGQINPTNATALNYTVTFNETVTGVDVSDFTVTIGGGSTIANAFVASVAQVSGSIYTVTVNSGTGGAGLAADTIKLDFIDNDSVRDLSNNATGGIGAGNGNFGGGQTYTIDKTGPTVTINQAAGQADPQLASLGTTVNFTVVFSEAVTNFATGDVSLSGSAGATLATVTGAGTTYNVAVTGMTQSGSVIAALGLGVATDASGNPSSASTSTDNTVTFTDNVAPTVTINQAAGQADPQNASAGSTINFAIVFSESVVGFTSSDVTLVSTAGPVTGNVTGSGATYNIAVTGMTQTGTVTATIGAGVATDNSGNANLAGTSVDNVVTFVDNIAPTATISAVTVSPTNATTINFTVTFSESVTGFAANDLALGGTSGGTKTAVVTGTGTTYNVAVTGHTSSGTVTASVNAGGATDPSGNGNTASGTASVTFDNVQPTVTVNQATGQTDPTNISPINFTVVFSEAVTGFVAGDVSIGGTAGATTAVVTTTDNITYNVAVSGMPATAVGTVTVTVAAGVASDAAGNTNTASTSTDNSVTFDGTIPSVTINQSAGQSDPTNSSTINFTVLFSESVTGFDGSDISFTGSTATGTLVATVTGSAATYNVAVTGMTGSGTVVASVVTSAAVDASGNASTASTSVDNTVTFDNVVPTVSINQDIAQVDPTNVSPIYFSVVFSESVTGFTSADVSFAGSTAPGVLVATVQGSGASYSVFVSGMTGSGTVLASIANGAAQDSAGNNSAASTSTDNTVTFDVTAPTVTINQAAGQADPTNASTINFTAVFSEAVVGFTGADVTFGGTLSGLTAAVTTSDNITFNIAVSGMSSSGTVSASIAAGVATDAAGNGNSASTSTDNFIAVDYVAPSVTINQAGAQADPTNGSPINFAVVFSEVVSGFTAADVVLGGTLGGTSAVVTTTDNITFNVAVSGMTGTGTVTASIAAGAAADAAGNSSTASTSTDNTVTFDNVAPALTLNQAAGQSDPTNSSTINFTAVFSEAVSGFTSTDVQLSGTAGATTAVVTTTDNITFAIQVSGMTGSGTVLASVAGGAASDAAGNSNTGSTSTDNVVTFDNIAPTVTINQAASQADPSNNTTVNFTVVFSESVTGFDGSDVALSGTASATTAVVTGSGTTYNVAVTGMSSVGTVIASVGAGAAADAAGNFSTASTSTDNSVTFDNVAPTVTINQAAGQTDPTNTAPINFSVVFSESVSGFSSSDVVLATTGTLSGTPTITVTGGGTTYNVAVSGVGVSGTGTLTASISAGAAADAAGNSSAASTSIDNTVTVDLDAPTVTINQAAGQADPVTSPSATTISFTVVFNESVTGFTASDVTIAGTAAGAAVTSVTGSGATYTVNVAGMTTVGTVIATVAAGAASDSAGNTSIASTSTDNSVTFSPILASSRFFRMYNKQKDFFFYTSSTAEFNNLKAIGLVDEATGKAGFGISPTQATGTLPIHRFYIPSTGDHYYTIDQGNELNFLLANPQTYKSEGTVGFLWNTQVPGTIPVFQLYNKVSGAHLYTSDANERSTILANFPTVWEANTNFGFAVAQSAGAFTTGGASQIPARRAAAMAAGPESTVSGSSALESSSNFASAGVFSRSLDNLGSLLETQRQDSSAVYSASPSSDEPGNRLKAYMTDSNESEVDGFWETIGSGIGGSFWESLN